VAIGHLKEDVHRRRLPITEKALLDQIMVGPYEEASKEVKELWIYIGTIFYGEVFKQAYGNDLCKGQVRSASSILTRLDPSDEALCFTILAVKMEEIQQDWTRKTAKKKGRKKRRLAAAAAAATAGNQALVVMPSTELVQREDEYRAYYETIIEAREKEPALGWYSAIVMAVSAKAHNPNQTMLGNGPTTASTDDDGTTPAAPDGNETPAVKEKAKSVKRKRYNSQWKSACLAAEASATAVFHA